MKRWFVSLLPVCVAFSFTFILLFITPGSASTALAQDAPPPLAEHCVDVGPLPPDLSEWCGCVWGEIYVDGVPTAGITVTLAYSGNSIPFVTTDAPSTWDRPLFAMDGALLGAVRGSTMTVTAIYAGQTVTRTYRALPDPQRQAQRVALVFPSEGAPPTRPVIAQATWFGDQIHLRADDSAETLLGYEWRSDVDGVIGTQAEVFLRRTDLATGPHTISLRVQNDTGLWSEPMTTTLVRRASAGVFEQAPRLLESGAVWAVAFGDVNGDGSPDILSGSAGDSDSTNRIWLNQGDGTFQSSGRVLGTGTTEWVDLADVNGDGHLDAVIVNSWNGDSEIWLNDGEGGFVRTSDFGQNAYSAGAALGDLDGDGDLDIFLANWDGQPNQVWLNNGSGGFSDTGQRLGDVWSLGVALGDLDQDGDLDAFVANAGANRIWLNDGKGNFTDSGQRLDTGYSNSVALADLDDDGDLDAFVGNGSQEPNRVWLNNGAGVFADTGQRLGNNTTESVSVADVDGDGDLDAVTANDGPETGDANWVWLNDGNGMFVDSGQRLGNGASRGGTLGDLDGDGDPDAAFGNEDGVQVWFNRAPGPQLRIHKSAPLTATAGSPVTYTIRVTNTGELTATNIVITDVLPLGANYLSGGERISDTVYWRANSLPPGDEILAQFAVTASHSLVNEHYGVDMAEGSAILGRDAVETFITAEWRVMLYMAGDNSLSSGMEQALERVRQMQPAPGVVVYVLFDGRETGDSRLYEIQNSGVRRPQPEWLLDEINTGDPAYLIQLANWAAQRQPARHNYFAIVNHGAGLKGIGWDATSNNDFVDSVDLARFVQDTAQQIDVLHLDACLMGMTELAYLLAEKVDYLVASQNLAWGIFAYDDYLSDLSTQTPTELATQIAERYQAHPRLANYPLTIATIDLTEMTGLDTKLSQVVQALLAQDYTDEMAQILDGVQRFDSQNYFFIDSRDEMIDLYHFVQRVQAQIDDAGVGAAAQAVLEHLDAQIIGSNARSGLYGPTYWNLEKAHGLSIFYPTGVQSCAYVDYADSYSYTFPGQSDWIDLLARYVGAPSSACQPGDIGPAPVLIPSEPDHSLYLPVVTDGG